jgi:hypothetical protein
LRFFQLQEAAYDLLEKPKVKQAKIMTIRVFCIFLIIRVCKYKNIRRYFVWVVAFMFKIKEGLFERSWALFDMFGKLIIFL